MPYLDVHSIKSYFSMLFFQPPHTCRFDSRPNPHSTIARNAAQVVRTALSAALTQKQLSAVALIFYFVILIATILSFLCLVFCQFHDQRRRNLDHTLLGHGRHSLTRRRSSKGFVTRVPVPLVEGLSGRLRKKGRHFDSERPIKGPLQRVLVGCDNSRRHHYAEIPY